MGFLVPRPGINQCSLHWKADSLPLDHLGSPQGHVLNCMPTLPKTWFQHLSNIIMTNELFHILGGILSIWNWVYILHLKGTLSSRPALLQGPNGLMCPELQYWTAQQTTDMHVLSTLFKISKTYSSTVSGSGRNNNRNEQRESLFCKPANFSPLRKLGYSFGNVILGRTV